MSDTPVRAAFDQGQTPEIAVFNKAKTPLGLDLAKLVAALQKFVDDHVVPVWSTPARLVLTDGFKPGAWGVSTRKGKTIYVHVFDWSKDSVRLPAIGARVVKARLVGGKAGNPGGCSFSQDVAGVTIHVAAPARDPADTVIALDLDRSALTIPAVEVASS